MPASYEPNPAFIEAAGDYLTVLKSLRAAYNELRVGTLSLGLDSLDKVKEAVRNLESRGDTAELDDQLIQELGPTLQDHLPQTELFSLHRDSRKNVLRLVVRLPGTAPTVVAASSFAIGVWSIQSKGYTDQVAVMTTDPARFLADNCMTSLPERWGTTTGRDKRSVESSAVQRRGAMRFNRGPHQRTQGLAHLASALMHIVSR